MELGRNEVQPQQVRVARERFDRLLERRIVAPIRVAEYSAQSVAMENTIEHYDSRIDLSSKKCKTEAIQSPIQSRKLSEMSGTAAARNGKWLNGEEELYSVFPRRRVLSQLSRAATFVDHNPVGGGSQSEQDGNSYQSIVISPSVRRQIAPRPPTSAVNRNQSAEEQVPHRFLRVLKPNGNIDNKDKQADRQQFSSIDKGKDETVVIKRITGRQRSYSRRLSPNTTTVDTRQKALTVQLNLSIQNDVANGCETITLMKTPLNSFSSKAHARKFRLSTDSTSTLVVAATCKENVNGCGVSSFEGCQKSVDGEPCLEEQTTYSSQCQSTNTSKCESEKKVFSFKRRSLSSKFSGGQPSIQKEKNSLKLADILQRGCKESLNEMTQEGEMINGGKEEEKESKSKGKNVSVQGVEVEEGGSLNGKNVKVYQIVSDHDESKRSEAPIQCTSDKPANIPDSYLRIQELIDNTNGILGSVRVIEQDVKSNEFALESLCQLDQAMEVMNKCNVEQIIKVDESQYHNFDVDEKEEQVESQNNGVVINNDQLSEGFPTSVNKKENITVKDCEELLSLVSAYIMQEETEKTVKYEENSDEIVQVKDQNENVKAQLNLFVQQKDREQNEQKKEEYIVSDEVKIKETKLPVKTKKGGPLVRRRDVFQEEFWNPVCFPLNYKVEKLAPVISKQQIAKDQKSMSHEKIKTQIRMAERKENDCQQNVIEVKQVVTNQYGSVERNLPPNSLFEEVRDTWWTYDKQTEGNSYIRGDKLEAEERGELHAHISSQQVQIAGEVFKPDYDDWDNEFNYL